jgi:hypothetical protein
MKFADIIALIGQPIRSEAVRDFFAANGIKSPKTAISGKAGESSFWVTSRKLKMDFLFGIEVLNKKYPVSQAERKGLFVPILTAVLFHERAQVDYPFGLDYHSSFDALQEKLGAPICPGLLYFPTRRNFTVMLDAEKEVELMIAYESEEKDVREIWLRLRLISPLIRLYFPLLGETAQKLADDTDLNGHLFFVHWAVTHDYLPIGTEATRDQLKSGQLGIVDFAAQAFADKSYLAKEDFVNIDPEFISCKLLGFRPLNSWKDPVRPAPMKGYTAKEFSRYAEHMERAYQAYKDAGGSQGQTGRLPC